MINTDFSKLELYTTVYSKEYGKGFIFAIDKRTPSYPVVVYFDKIEQLKSYSPRGTEGPFAFYPTLFLEEQVIPKEAYQEPMPRLSKDTLICVKEKGKWVRRYFKKWNGTNPICYSNGGNSLTTNKCQTYLEWSFNES